MFGSGITEVLVQRGSSRKGFQQMFVVVSRASTRLQRLAAITCRHDKTQPWIGQVELCHERLKF